MLRLGVIGMSPGNGHPYSWSAIFNGYNKNAECSFEVIPKYLAKQKFPDSFLSNIAKVTHIYTDNLKVSKLISKFSNIEKIVTSIDEMVGSVDAVLLARDDAENHFKYAKVFIEKNIPIFIDKPIAYSVKEAKKIFSINNNCLIFSCSSMRFAKEFSKKYLKNNFFVSATVMKNWERYGIHIIEPVISMFPNRGKLKDVKKINLNNGIKIRTVEWDNLTANFIVTNDIKTQIKIEVSDKNQNEILIFEDTFFAFRESLRFFIDLINNKKSNILRSETLEIIDIIEKGI